MPETQLDKRDLRDITFGDLLQPDTDLSRPYLEERERENAITGPLGQIIKEVEGTGEEGQPGQPGQRVVGTREEAQEIEAQIKAGDKPLQEPTIDPVSAFIGGGTGGFLLGGAKTLAQKIATGAVSGGISTAAEFPIGQAGELVGEQIPGAELPFTVVAGILSGVTLEKAAEKAAGKALSALTGKLASPKKVKKAADAAIDSIKNDLPLDDVGEAVKATIQKEASDIKQAEIAEGIEKESKKVIDDILGSESKPLVEIIPKEKLGEFLTAKPDLEQTHAININLSKVNSTDDVKEILLKTAETFEGSIQEARRGVQSFAETARLADELNMTPTELLKRRRGQAFNPEEAKAARDILVSSGERLKEMVAALKSPNAGKLEMVAYRKQMTLHKAIMEQVTGVAAEAGRTLNALKIPAGSTKLQLKQIDDIITAMGDDGELTETMADALLMLDDPKAINAFVDKAYRATTKDVIFELFYNAILSGPQTQAVNVLSNSLVAAWQIPERFLSAGFSKLINNSDDSVKFGEAVAQSFGFVQGMKDGIIAAGRVIKTEVPEDIVGKLERPLKRAISGSALGLSGTAGRTADYLGRAVRMPGTFLSAGDSFFKSVGYRMELNARAYRQISSEGLKGKEAGARMQEIISNPPEDIKLAAIDAARYQTFTNELTGLANDYQKAVGKYPILRVITPFVRTPTNIVKFFGERSPFAPLVKSFREDVQAGGSRRDLAMARMALGNATMATAAVMAAEGKITGGGPADPNLKSLYYDTGWEPYSIKIIGDKYVPYGRLEPLGTLLGVAADFSDISGEIGKQDADEIVAHLAMSVAKNVTSKTFLRGITDVIKGLDDPVRYGERYFQNLFATIIPTGVSAIARKNDPVLREVNSVMDKIKSRVPGWSKTLPPKRNLWGTEIILRNGFGPGIISSLYEKKMEDNPVSQEMIDNQISVSKPNKQIMGVELSPEEYDFYVDAAGKPALKELEKQIKKQQYLRQSTGADGGRSILIKSVIMGFREKAQFETIKKFPELRIEIDRRNRQRAQQLQPQAAQQINKQLGGVTITNEGA